MKKLQNFLVYLMYLGVVCFIRKGKSSCVSPAVCDLTPAEVTHELNLSREKGRGSEKGKETPQRETVRRRPGCGRTVQKKKKINSCFLHLTAFPCPKGRMGTRVGVRRSERDGRVCEESQRAVTLEIMSQNVCFIIVLTTSSSLVFQICLMLLG